MAFVNTRDTIGDQATVDRLVEHSLTELKEDGIGIVETYACSKNTGLQSVELPSVSQIKANAFDGCSNLEVVKLGGEGSSGALSIAANAFSSCTKLKHMVIDRTEQASLTETSIISTPIYDGDGAIYVPSNMIDTYNKKFGNYFIIVDKNRYPLSVFDNITDSWSDIHNSIVAGTDTKYGCGCMKSFTTTDGQIVTMVLIGKNVDKKSDDSGYAHFTWLCKYIYALKRMHGSSTLDGGWGESELRDWLNTDVLSKIPSEVREHIVPVDKTCRVKSPTDETLLTSDNIWIPSYKEVGFTGTSYIESDGIVYTMGYYGTYSRKKHVRSESSCRAWWLRSMASSSIMSVVGDNGKNPTSGVGAYTITRDNGVVFGFCTD